MQVDLDRLQLRSHSVPARFPPKQKPAAPRLAADVRKAEKRECFRFAQPTVFAVLACVATKLDQACLLGMQFQAERLKTSAHVHQKRSGISLMLESCYQIIGVSHHDHVAMYVLTAPLLGPEVEHEMEVDVSHQRRDHRTLRGSALARRQYRSLQDANFQPFANQAKDSSIGNPLLDETVHPIVVHRIKEGADICVDDPIHGRVANPNPQRVQRVMLAAPRPKSVAKAEKLLLVYRVEYLDHRPLKNLVFDRRDSQRSLAAIRLRNHPAPRW